MAARRCSDCALDYPLEYHYTKCLRCGGETWPAQNVEPMAKDDLDQLKQEVQAVKDRIAGTNEQWLVVYNDRQAQNPNGEYRSEVFFATAYTFADANELISLCKRLYPKSVDSVRAIVATGRPPKDAGPVAVAT